MDGILTGELLGVCLPTDKAALAAERWRLAGQPRPNRVLDPQRHRRSFWSLTNHAARTFTVSGVPLGATAVTGSLTVTGQTSSGYMFMGPTATNNPTSSTLNFPVGDERANAVTVALGAGGSLSITFVAPRNGPTLRPSSM